MNAADARAIDANRRPLREHVDEYLADCARSGQAIDHVANKRTLLTRFVDAANVARLSDLSPDALARHLRAVAAAGRSARTQNAVRAAAAAVTFVNWCVA